MKHQLYKTGDKDAPESIKDQNGEVVLDLCKVCGKGEAELRKDCLSTREQAFRWWNSLTSHEKQSLADKYGYDLMMYSFKSLKNEDVEEIWREETQESISDEDMQMLTDECKYEIFENDDKEFDLKNRLNQKIDLVTGSYGTGKSHSIKSNQKQFKEFDAELHLNHLSKFSLRDRYNAVGVGLTTLDLSTEDLYSITSILVKNQPK